MTKLVSCLVELKESSSAEDARQWWGEIFGIKNENETTSLTYFSYQDICPIKPIQTYSPYLMHLKNTVTRELGFVIEEQQRELCVVALGSKPIRLHRLCAAIEESHRGEKVVGFQRLVVDPVGDG